MNRTKPRNVGRIPMRRRSNSRITARRLRKEQTQECPAFLIRLVGEARAKDLFSEVIIHHRHD